MESAAPSFLTTPKVHFPGFHLPKSSRNPSIRRPLLATISRRKSCRCRLRQSVHKNTPKCSRATSATSPSSHQPTAVSRLNEIGSTLLACVQKPLALALFCLAVGSAPFFLPSPAHAMAVRGLSFTSRDERNGQKGNGSMPADEHQFSGYTRQLLRTVSYLSRVIDKAKSGKVGMDVVKEALEEVKAKRIRIQKNVLDSLDSELQVLRKKKLDLIKRSRQAFDAGWAAAKERDQLLKKGGGVDERNASIELLQKTMDNMEEEYNQLWEKIDAIDDNILKKEITTFSIAIRELSFIERESELLVERFKAWLTQKSVKSQEQTLARLSKDVLRNELEKARKEYFEQIVLPTTVKAEDLEQFADGTTGSFVLNIRQALRNTNDIQRDLESQMKQNLKRCGTERRFFVRTPEEEAVKGYPAAEVKWMFGNKEVIVPNAVRLQLLHGWKKWRENAKANLKKELVENPDRGREYISVREESILIDRDRLVSRTWYNEKKKRWEMDPVAVPFAVSKKLVERARIRHDWVAMYLSLKGDDKEYFIDIREFDILFEDFGGFEGLYTKLLASGTPTSVHFMWIPFSEMLLQQQIMLTLKLSYQAMVGIQKSWIVYRVKHMILSRINNINDDLMVTFGFPIIERLPLSVRTNLGMAWPEEADQVAQFPWFIRWQADAELNYRLRKSDGITWYLRLVMRTAVYGYIIFLVFNFMRVTMRKIPSLLGYPRNPNEWKTLKMMYFISDVLEKKIRFRAHHPVEVAFDRMKRIKNPPIRLDDFVNIESLREEIKEIVTFLRNPGAFQKMGARAPKGVLIIGEEGAGKTSLALAIAAEAKVPLVEVKAGELDNDIFVGLSAAYLRELFQTARDLAPVIIFVRNFEDFAGARGQSLRPLSPNHEAFINQLLVELDGFEKQDGVVLIATTSNPTEIDEALQRPGRMDRVLHLQRLTQLERETILRVAANETMDDDLIEFVDWVKVAEKTVHMRPTDLKLVPLALEGSALRSKFLDSDELTSYCGWFMTLSHCIPDWLRRTPPVKMISSSLVNHLGLTLTKEDFESAVDLMEPYGLISQGIEIYSPIGDWTREAKFPHAVWAAGRGLIALLLPNFDTVHNIWLEPSSWQGIGCTKITKAKTEGSFIGNVETRSYLEKKLVFCFGSYIASEMLIPFGEENYLSESELSQAQEIATRMVLQYGWGPDDSPTVYVCNGAMSVMSMGGDYELEMAAKIEKIYNLAYDRARHMLLRNRAVLEQVVEELLEFEALSRKDLQRILDGYGGIQENEPFFLAERHMQPFAGRFLGNGNGSGLSLTRAS